MSPLVIALFAVVAVASSAPVEQATQIPILRQSQDSSPDGSYNYNYETGNGINVEEQGYVKTIDAENEAMQVQGSYSFSGDDGVVYSVTYIADENGYQPQGDHLPTSPPIPPQILRALEYNAAHPELKEVEEH